MLSDHVDVNSIDTLRGILDRVDVGRRLQHIRAFIWRGGLLQVRADGGRRTHLLNVCYALMAEWAAPVVERPTQAEGSGLVSWHRPVVDGRWVRGRKGYELCVGIDLAIPSVIYVRSPVFSSYVPFLGRPPAQVEDCLNVELTVYVNTFLSHCQPVPQAAALDADRLRRLGLAAYVSGNGDHVTAGDRAG